ncbi:MAG TPA: glycosyltransferase family 4 protein [Acidimicrobiales bacterium]|nr:glycosyltransferase family 4 protein [Acidimicrobiales bacterium]
MRVAMVCPYSLSRPGGVQGQVQGLARALRDLGHQVAVVAPDDRGRPGPAGPDAYRIGRPAAVRSNGSVAPVSLSPLAPVRARQFARRYRADVVHLHEPLAPLAGYGCLVAGPAPVVGTYHRSGDSRAYELLGPLARWANARMAVRCAVSEAAADTARVALGGDYEVLFNGVEVERFAGARPWPTEGPTVLFLGRHEQRKGLAVLLDAFTSVPGPAVLWVAGDGPETAALRGRHPASDRVRWLGVLDDAEVASRLAGAQVLCAPSLGGESFGMVLLEGMAAGCTVVASDIAGYRAAAGGHAVLVPPGEPAALGTALAAALADTGPGADAARRAALGHAEQWSMGHLATRYVAVYERAIGARAIGARAVR